MPSSAAPQLAHEYRPVGSAKQLFECRDPEVLMSGAAGTGKSRAALEKVHAMCLLHKGLRALIVRKSAVSLTSTGLVTFREIVGKEAIESGEVRFYGGSRQEAASFKYGNGSTITVGGMDKASRIMSSEYDLAYVQEAIELEEDDWEAITTRLRNGVSSFQQLIADTNPGAPHHWLNQRCTRGQCTMITSVHEDNPRLYDDGRWTVEGLDYITRLEALSGVRYLRLRKGIWAAAEGLVYGTYDPVVHLHPQIKSVPKGWNRYLSIDFGFRNPFTAQWWAEDPDGRLYMYRELYGTGMLVEDWAKEIRSAVHYGDGQRHPDEMPTTVICDHDAEDRATLERHLDVGTIAATKNVSEGIQAVQSRLRVAEDGRPRLYICRDALVRRDAALEQGHKPLCLQDEMLEYVWDSSTYRSHSSQGSGSTVKEAPLKQNDHGADAMRYVVAHVDLVGSPRFRWF